MSNDTGRAVASTAVQAPVTCMSVPRHRNRFGCTLQLIMEKHEFVIIGKPAQEQRPPRAVVSHRPAPAVRIDEFILNHSRVL